MNICSFNLKKKIFFLKVLPMVFYFEVLAEVMEKLMCRGCQREICSGGQKPILKFAFVLFKPSLRSRETSSVSFHNRTEPFQIKQERKKCPDVVPVSNLKSRMQGWLLGWLNIPKCISSCFHGSRSEAGGKGEKLTSALHFLFTKRLA